MNFYRRFPGDYARDTMELNFVQHGAYTLLLDVSYTTEKELPLNRRRIHRMTRAESRAERKAIDFVLKNFYTKTPNGYAHKRVMEEISHAKSRINAARENGKRSPGRPRKQNPVGFSGKPNENPVGFCEKPAGLANGNPEPNPEKSSPDSRLQTPETLANRSRTRAGKAPSQADPLFAKFWDDYPRKIRRKEAETSWRRLSEAERLAAVEALSAFIASDAWQEQAGKFVPSPCRFLSEKRWEHPPVADRQKGARDARNGSARLRGDDLTQANLRAAGFISSSD
jgi:uncharacterized protein YdaU (DUF1376 family)